MGVGIGFGRDIIDFELFIIDFRWRRDATTDPDPNLFSKPPKSIPSQTKFHHNPHIFLLDGHTMIQIPFSERIPRP